MGVIGFGFLFVCLFVWEVVDGEVGGKGVWRVCVLFLFLFKERIR